MHYNPKNEFQTNLINYFIKLNWSKTINWKKSKSKPQGVHWWWIWDQTWDEVELKKKKTPWIMTSLELSCVNLLLVDWDLTQLMKKWTKIIKKKKEKKRKRTKKRIRNWVEEEGNQRERDASMDDWDKERWEESKRKESLSRPVFQILPFFPFSYLSFTDLLFLPGNWNIKITAAIYYLYPK